MSSIIMEPPWTMDHGTQKFTGTVVLDNSDKIIIKISLGICPDLEQHLQTTSQHNGRILIFMLWHGGG